MRMLRTIRLRLRSIVQRRRVDAELDDELRDHLERQVEVYVRGGMPEAAARAAARREFGSLALVQEQCRDTRRVGMLEDGWRDVRYALRAMRRAPGFTAVAALSLALAIGANTSIFSLVHVLLLRDLPVVRPQALVEILRVTEQGAGSFSYPFYERLRDGQTSFGAVFAMSRGTFEAAIDGQPGTPLGRMVSGNFFATLGLSPAAGRLLAPADDRADGEPRGAVIAYRRWHGAFGGDPAVGGRPTIRPSNAGRTISSSRSPASPGCGPAACSASTRRTGWRLSRGSSRACPWTRRAPTPRSSSRASSTTSWRTAATLPPRGSGRSVWASARPAPAWPNLATSMRGPSSC
jgi:hypothetical protein